MGEYTTISKGYQGKRITHLREHRDLLAAILREQPKKLFPLPGDVDYRKEIKFMTSDEIDARARKLGFAHLLGIDDGKCDSEDIC